MTKAQRSKIAKRQWAKLTPDERSTEMRRRVRIGRADKRKAAGPESSLKNLLEATNAAVQAQDQDQYSQHISYLFGSFSKELDLYCSRSGVPRSAIAGGVGSLLLREEGR